MTPKIKMTQKWRQPLKGKQHEFEDQDDKVFAADVTLYKVINLRHVCLTVFWNVEKNPYHEDTLKYEDLLKN